MNRAGALVVGLFLVATRSFTWGAEPVPDLARLAHEAVGEDGELAARAVAALRAAGPAGLEAFRHENAGALAKGPAGFPDIQWEHIYLPMEEVAMAHDAYASGLYWYTDLDQAKAAAKAGGKPILSLRLLGGLDSDESCANSRYFRTVLYANKAVADYLRQNFILHWQSVRKAPLVTIDFGDGRKLTRTITGNSIHYVLDPDGNIVDALPGLYGPGAFVRELQQAAPIAAKATTPQARAQFAEAKAKALGEAWRNDLAQLGITMPTEASPATAPPSKPPTAPEAGPKAMSKFVGERPILREIFPAAAMRELTEATGWARLAALHKDDAELDPGSLRLMVDKSRLLRESKGMPAASPMVAAFTSSVALDTVRDEYLMHRTLCEWLAEARGNADLNTFNDRVYAELFLTPASDPWLGLLPSDVYTAIQDDGIFDGPVLRQSPQ